MLIDYILNMIGKKKSYAVGTTWTPRVNMKIILTADICGSIDTERRLSRVYLELSRDFLTKGRNFWE